MALLFRRGAVDPPPLLSRFAVLIVRTTVHHIIIAFWAAAIPAADCRRKPSENAMLCV